MIVRSALLYTGVVGLWMLVAPFPALGQWIADQPNFKALYSVVGRMYNIDADLLEAIAEVESGGDPGSVSPKGALGLMQLMPSTATEFSVLDPFDPVSNILGAADFLESLRQRFAGSLNLQTLPDLLAAYNAGPGAVEKYGWVPPYPETHKYIKRVIERYANAECAASRVSQLNPETDARGHSAPTDDDDGGQRRLSFGSVGGDPPPAGPVRGKYGAAHYLVGDATRWAQLKLTCASSFWICQGPTICRHAYRSQSL